MKTGPAGLSLIKEYEQCRLRAFKPIPTDPWTIGFGHTHDVDLGDVCTQEQADLWLIEDVIDAEHAITSNVHYPLSQNQFDALVSWQYNTGAIGHSTLRDVLNAGKVDQAADEFLRWNKSKGVVLAGLTKRREDERLLFRTPDSKR